MVRTRLMVALRLRVIAAAFAVIALGLAGPAGSGAFSSAGDGSTFQELSATGPGAAAGPSSTATSSCVWKWKKKIVIRKVHRHGKVKRIRKVRYYRVCVPVKPPVVDPARLGVRAFEYGLTLSRQTLVAGDTIVELNNAGEDAHNLHITRIDSGADVAIPETPASAINKVRFDTTPGTYRLFCSLPDHAALGMDATIEVTAP